MIDRTDHNRLAALRSAAFISMRVAETEAFEARASGKAPPRKPKRNVQPPAQEAQHMQTAPSEAATTQVDMVIAGSPSAIDIPPMPATKTKVDLVATGTSPSSLLDVIIHAGSDPSFDVEKFRALITIQREEQDRQDTRADRLAELEAEAAFDATLSDVQGKIRRIAANQHNIQTKSNYADYAALDRVLRPVYVAAGFSLSFDEEDSPKPDHIRVVCWVTHVAPGSKRSHKRKYHADMPADGKGAKGGDVMTKTHATGSAFTYGKRYVAGNIFNIAIGRDDDGNAATPQAKQETTPPGTISAAQAAEIRKLLEERSVAPRAFLQFIRLPSIEHIGIEHFDRAVTKIKSFGAR